MDQKQLKQILENVRDGNMSVDEACLKVREAPYTDIGYARIDNHRALRQGCAEVIYGAGKTAEQILGISMTMKERGVPCILITRISPEKELLLRGRFEPYRYEEISRTAIIGKMPEADGMGQIVVATGGTSDIPVSEEAALTAEALGNKVLRLYDVGVSGLHRLLDHLDDLMSATVIIAVAGMERDRRPCFLPRHRRADFRRLRGQFQRSVRPSFHAEFLRERRIGRQHR